ncbi:type II toxin-antitoxin system VapC family toxin [Paracoccus liaowanqingii]|uniref:Type II toxin-antitoxin system VapC family toxin n=2 Tax=Paracoccus liaowanqingii TaxID=2560053 RepID=A0A4Z1BLF0_9RHOB|nr:type II toxin-antitoxin system VapC family toxin [Paracoccus liaowanqingii]
MMFILDTNVVSELRKAKAGKADSNVVAWAAVQDPSALFLSAITLLELEMGIRQAERRDSAQGAVLRAWMTDRVLPTFEGRILPVDGPVALCCAALHVPDPRSDRDALIAATGIVHAMPIVTRNVADFAPTGVTIIHPWDIA